MPTYPAPVLEIIYGSTTINLLARGKGWHLTGFRPRTAELKNGGTWQSSPLSNGRQPVSYRYDNIIDTWTVSADGYNEDGIIELAQELERAGVSALDYWTADWADTPVYIKARGPKETNTRYAIIHQIRVPEYADQYRQPMFGLDAPVMDGLSVIIEHGQWQNVAPGSQECVAVSSAFEWQATETWSINTTAPTGDVLCLHQTSGGRILAGTNDAGKIFYSDDDGASWSLLATLAATTDSVEDFAENGGYIYAAVRSSNSSYLGLWRSANNGGSWTRVFSTWGVTSVVAYNTSDVLIGAARLGAGIQCYYNTSHGTGSWTSIGTQSNTIANKIVRADSGVFLIAHNAGISRVPADYSSISYVYSLAFAFFNNIIQTESGRFLVTKNDGTIHYSDNADGDSGSWGELWSGGATGFHGILEDTDGRIYAGDDGIIWVSDDDGTTLSVDSSVPAGIVYAFLQLDNGDILASDDDDILTDVLSGSSVNMGSLASCANQVYIANKTQITNLTHIKVYDDSATSFVDIYPTTSYPVELLPTTPADDDAVYFGVDSNLDGLDAGPFSSLVFDLASPFVGWTTVAWEYWNGSAWSALTVKDNTLSLLQTGVNSVHWVPPSDWATTAVEGVTGYWVRFRVDTIATSPEPPTQQNRNIYAVVNPYVEIAAAQIGGDIPALARVRVENVSDADGPGGSAPDLYANRVIIGLRSVSRGALFSAYLNAADEQNPVGVTVTAGTDTAFADLVGAPSGRIVQWSPTGTGSWVTILTFTLSTTIATQYYGTFRVFLRARQSGGTAGQMQLRLRTSTGSGGVSITTDAQVFANTNDHQIIDFGQLTIPLSAYLKSTELGDVLTVAVQGYTSSTTPDANLYDLILIPVDEWAADLTDGENSAASALSNGFYLDVDSVSFPKRQLRNAVKSAGTNYTKAIWQQIANGPAILQANERQRLWLLSLRTASAGSSDWRSEPDVVHRVQMWSAERYRWARGSR